MIEVKNLVKKYGNHMAVDHLSFTVEKGQILGFLGPNGAGKSTTMNIITGYISATEGEVVINGHDIFEEPEEAKKSIGYLPELPPLYPDMTVLEYLKFVADIKKVEKKEKDEMIHKVMEKTKITDMSERLIKHLSKGYKQRVGLAQAILGYPDVIILDEPTVGLDPMQIIEIRDLIKELAKEHTVIISSHILAEISAVCDTVLIINKGKLVVQDTPDNLSKYIGSSTNLKLQVKGEIEQIMKALEEVKGLTKIEVIKSTSNRVTLNAFYDNKNEDEDEDIRETVFYAMSRINCPILEMHSSTMSLEDIFLEVTKENTSDEKKKLRYVQKNLRVKSIKEPKGEVDNKEEE